MLLAAFTNKQYNGIVQPIKLHCLRRQNISGHGVDFALSKIIEKFKMWIFVDFINPK